MCRKPSVSYKTINNLNRCVSSRKLNSIENHPILPWTDDMRFFFEKHSRQNLHNTLAEILTNRLECQVSGGDTNDEETSH